LEKHPIYLVADFQYYVIIITNLDFLKDPEASSIFFRRK